MVHISRLSEELVYWISQPFSFVKLPDRFTTGSSIMPQKKNPTSSKPPAASARVWWATSSPWLCS